MLNPQYASLFGVISVFWKRFFSKSPVLEGIRSLDWETTFFLIGIIGIFVIVGSLTLRGWIETIVGSLWFSG